MDNEPLLAYTSPRTKQLPPSPLFTLPEDGEISIPIPLTPSELKDRLIFGSSSPSESNHIADALAPSLSSPRASSSNSIAHDLYDPPFSSPSSSPTTADLQHSPPAWLIDPKHHPWIKTNLHRSKTAPAMAVINDLKNRRKMPKPQFGSNSIVRQAFVLLVLYLSLGVVIYWLNRDHFVAIQTHPVVDALYFCIVTMCTIGYGDITPNSVWTKLFSILFVLAGFGFIDILLSGMVSYVLDLQENYLLRTIKHGVGVGVVGAHGEEESPGWIIDVKRGRMRIRMKVALALGVVVLCIGVGVVVMHFVEQLGWNLGGWILFIFLLCLLLLLDMVIGLLGLWRGEYLLLYGCLFRHSLLLVRFFIWLRLE